MHRAKADAALDEVWVVYPGPRAYELAAGITARPLAECVPA
jgi:hypothetical protein